MVSVGVDMVVMVVVVVAVVVPTTVDQSVPYHCGFLLCDDGYGCGLGCGERFCCYGGDGARCSHRRRSNDVAVSYRNIIDKYAGI